MWKFIASLTLAMGLWLPLAQAAQVEGLYEADVAVVDKSPSLRTEGIVRGLEQVLLKLTGREQEAHRLAQQFADQATGLVKRYDYGNATATEAQSGLLRLHIKYDKKYLNQLLLQQHVPLWGENRPLILVWLAYEDPTGRHIVGETDELSSANQFEQQFSHVFSRYGVPVLFPLMDLPDQEAVSVAEVWGQHQQSLLAASQRYNADIILSGRVAQRVDGRWLGEWTLLNFAGETQSWQSQDYELESVLKASAEDVARSLSARFAIDDKHFVTVNVNINPIADLAGYAATLQYFKKLDIVRHSEVELIKGDTLTLRCDVRGGVAALKQTIALDNLMQITEPRPGQEAPEFTASHHLSLRYTR